MKLAAAQTNPKDGDLEHNISDHIQFTKLAGDHNAQLIVFPEMSLTGYQWERGEELALVPMDKRLESLRKQAIDSNIVIVAGGPIKIDNELFIGAFIMKPDGTETIYTKQYLHTGEENYYSPGIISDYSIQLDNQKVSFAICADITNPLHPEYASMLGTDLYVASIFYSPQGISEAYLQLSEYASKYKMNVLMSNFTGNSYNYPSAGQSGFWNSDGELIQNLSENEEGLLLVEKLKEGWAGKVISLKLKGAI